MIKAIIKAFSSTEEEKEEAAQKWAKFEESIGIPQPMKLGVVEPAWADHGFIRPEGEMTPKDIEVYKACLEYYKENHHNFNAFRDISLEDFMKGFKKEKAARVPSLGTLSGFASDDWNIQGYAAHKEEWFQYYYELTDVQRKTKVEELKRWDGVTGQEIYDEMQASDVGNWEGYTFF